MAQLNITLNQEEIQALLLEDSGEGFKKILQACLNKLLQVESAEQLKAAPYERTEDRTDSRNGSRDRDYNTRVGTITLRVPRHRNVPFKTLLFDNYSRSEAALIASMAEMVVNGVSTRKVSKVMETLCGTSFSKSAVSDVCKDLDKNVKEFRNRPIAGDGGRYLFQSTGEQPGHLQGLYDCLRHKRRGTSGNSWLRRLRKRIYGHMDRFPHEPEKARTDRASHDYIGCS